MKSSVQNLNVSWSVLSSRSCLRVRESLRTIKSIYKAYKTRRWGGRRRRNCKIKLSTVTCMCRCNSWAILSNFKYPYGMMIGCCKGLEEITPHSCDTPLYFTSYVDLFRKDNHSLFLNHFQHRFVSQLVYVRHHAEVIWKEQTETASNNPWILNETTSSEMQ